MAEPMRRPAGWEDILAAPEGTTAEVLSGELIFQPRPQPPHLFSQAGLMSFLGPPFAYGGEGPGGWWIVGEPDVAFGAQDIVAPDLAGWRKTRMPHFPTQRPITVVPDWVCEVLSPSSLRRDRVVKADLYLRHGVPHYWLVDAQGHILEAFEAREGGWFRLGAWTAGQRAAIPPFQEIEIEVGRLFPEEAAEQS